MKILIAYYTKTGVAETCAELLARELTNHKVTLADLSKESPDAGDFDAVVLGSSVRMGRLGRPFLDYVGVNHDAIGERTHGFFLCCSSEEGCERYMKKGIPDGLLDTAFDRAYFGGELRESRAKGFDKLVIRMMRRSYFDRVNDDDADKDLALPTIAEPVIAQFADKLKNKLFEA